MDVDGVFIIYRHIGIMTTINKLYWLPILITRQEVLANHRGY